MLNSTDVFVVGGGPAGLAAAIAARQRGLRVVVADGGQPPIDKACGEGLMPDGLCPQTILRLQFLDVDLSLGTSLSESDQWFLVAIRDALTNIHEVVHLDDVINGDRLLRTQSLPRAHCLPRWAT